jgi:hypothetical protein
MSSRWIAVVTLVVLVVLVILGSALLPVEAPLLAR